MRLGVASGAEYGYTATRGPVTCPAGDGSEDVMTLDAQLFDVTIGQQPALATAVYDVQARAYQLVVSSPKQPAPGKYDLKVPDPAPPVIKFRWM